MNYHHLLYFWKVAKRGSIARASAELELTQPTISEQIRALEASLDRKLFDRVGRSLVLTADGKKVFAYAEKIFALGGELTSALDEPSVSPRLRIGVEHGIPSRVIAEFLPESPVEATQEAAATLFDQQLDVILAREHKTKLHAHRLLNCGIVFLARKKVQLEEAGILLPPEPMRSLVRAWLKKRKLNPAIGASFDSEDLLWAFAQRSDAIFPAPDHGLPAKGFKLVDRVPELRYQVFAYTRERRPRHPEIAKMLARRG
jgi:LysR family transcriptional regulator, transcriptional activator of nhaA